jgi:hypothetical protein
VIRQNPNCRALSLFAAPDRATVHSRIDRRKTR